MGDVTETMREAREYISEKAAEAIHEQATLQSIRKIMKETGISVDRLRELAEADKAGRCVVLPFKVGDVVYTNISVIGDRYKKSQMPYAVKVVFIGMGGGNTYFHVEYSNGRTFPLDLSAIGKTVFLNREEAEAALEKMKKGGAND